VRWKRDNIVVFALVHLIAALALLPWLFSWTGVTLFVAGLVVVVPLGINLGYHRLLTHRGLSCPLWLERALAFLGVCSMQDSPQHWVAVHRRHHQFAEEEHDPHSPIGGFLWAHMGWLLVKRDDMGRGPLIARYARDIARDPFYAWAEQRNNWIKIGLASWLAFFAGGFAVMALSGHSFYEALQFGFSLMVWGGVLRTVVAWHTTWSVNSLSHVCGYRNYETPDDSRNNAWVALTAAGEGWHNNHHADPRSARHGHKWWELDLTFFYIRILMAVGLARDVVLPSPGAAAKYALARAAREAPDPIIDPAPAGDHAVAP